MNPFQACTFENIEKLRACSTGSVIYNVAFVLSPIPALYYRTGAEGAGAADDGVLNIRDIAGRTWTRSSVAALADIANISDFMRTGLEDWETAKEARVALGVADQFDTVSALLADTTLGYADPADEIVTAGDYISTRAEGFSYKVAVSGASDHHVTTAGGVKLYVQPTRDGYHSDAFGAIGDDSTVNTTALQMWLDAAEGDVAVLGIGTYLTLGLTPPSHTTIIGRGRDVSVLKMAGSSDANLITHQDKTNLVCRGVKFYGNSGATATGNGQAIRIYTTSGATMYGDGYDIQDCHFENFKGDVWVQFLNYSTTYRIRNPKVSNNSWKSLSGNCRDGATLGVQSTCVAFSGKLNEACYVENIECNNNVADGTYIKRFVEFWNGCRNFNCVGNRLENFGTDASVGIDGGNYAIMLYDSSLQTGMQNGVITNNTIDTFKSVGIYCAGASDTTISGNIIRHGSATSEVSMPRGGIVIGAGWNMLCSSNYIEDVGTNGIRVLGVGAWTGTGAGHTDIINNVRVSDNIIRGCATGIKLDGSGYAIGYTVGSLTLSDNRVSGFTICGNTLSENTTGVKAQTYGPVLEDVSIVDNDITSVVSGSRGVEGVVYAGGALGAAGFNCLNFLVQGNKINTAQYGILLPTAQDSVIIRDNTLSGDFSARGIQATSCENLALLNNTFQNVTASGQACYYTAGSKGIHVGTHFLDVDTNKISVGATDMGRAAPTWTPTGRGAVVESIMLTEVGTSPNKYVNRGWYYDGTAWREQRMLTGA